jgi:protoporphyrinogen oxidase
LEDGLKLGKNDVLILGGGLTGLSAGYVLARAGHPVSVFEADHAVGGIAKTIEHRGYRFDLGGHRFFTADIRIDRFVKELMADELVTVPRRSKIFMHGKYFDYPLKPMNAAFQLGIGTSVRVLGGYAAERVRGLFIARAPVSLEDWVVARFGRPLFDIFFKQYSEKVWGISCSRISAEWVDRRIQGLSLFKAVAYAMLKKKAAQLPTLVDSFVYPSLGIGRIADRLAAGIRQCGRIHTDTRIVRINHLRGRIVNVAVQHAGQVHTEDGEQFISSIPITALVTLLDPVPPDAIRKAAAGLRFRDLIVLALMIDRERVTDQAWIYLPERSIPFGRIHEPTNWSERMAPAGKTLLVLEFFCFRSDAVWSADDGALREAGIRHLTKLGFIRPGEVTDSFAVRVPNAYPLFEVGYEKYFHQITDYLAGFENLHLAGRAGMFRYDNMDHAMRSGMAVAEAIIKTRKDISS